MKDTLSLGAGEAGLRHMWIRRGGTSQQFDMLKTIAPSIITPQQLNGIQFCSLVFSLLLRKYTPQEILNGNAGGSTD